MTPDDLIKLDFGKYWPGCQSKALPIWVIQWAQQFGLRIQDLPKDVQEKIKQAYRERLPHPAP
jgi:hypothetical protein